MQEIILLLYFKFKLFFAWFITGAIYHYFEIKVGRNKFNLMKFILACSTFWLLVEGGHLAIEGGLIWNHWVNESADIILSIWIASFAFLFIPFVMVDENRNRFIEGIFNKFWFYKDK